MPALKLPPEAVPERGGALAETMKPPVRRLCISTQQSALAVKAFTLFVDGNDDEGCEYTFRETDEVGVVDDVRENRSEIGIIYLNQQDEVLFDRAIGRFGLEWHVLCEVVPCVMFHKTHPLASRSRVSAGELAAYPYIHVEKWDYLQIFDDVFHNCDVNRIIRVTDCGSVGSLFAGIHAFSITLDSSAGALQEEAVFVPLDVEIIYKIGAVTYERMEMSLAGQEFLDSLKSLAGIVHPDVSNQDCVRKS